ncbi:glycoside hydrolase family 3 protein [Candidatus Hepatincola sp. Av]
MIIFNFHYYLYQIIKKLYSYLFLLLLLIIFLLVTLVNFYGKEFDESLITNYKNVPLDIKIGQMLMLGFSGTTINKELADYIQKYHIGGVTLFNKPLANGKTSNITSKQQVEKLNASMQALADIKLFISVDQEGGFVARLNKSNGFRTYKSPASLGAMNNADAVYNESTQIAKDLKNSGFNMNFAPAIDVNINPNNPIIGAVDRSFSNDPNKVIVYGNAYIQGQHKYGIITSLKHFPGHGSSTKDSHLGLVDITNTYKPQEMKPFKEIIQNNYQDTVMVAHLINSKIDSKYPASLSRKFITEILREQLKFNGVVISDDLKMGAIEKYYGLDEAVTSFINAGGDIIAYSNNLGEYNKNVAAKIVVIIKKNIKNGKISMDRINESYLRIMKLKKEKLY